jgi:phosphopantothenoylcysteine decarboxylase/phosphopantothenate--cysteine ligase
MSNSNASTGGSKILFLLSGSIACFKSCTAISQFVKDGHSVQTAATSAALKFVGTSTLEGLTGKPVFVDPYSDGNQMDHIHLARWADILLLAPATANSIARLAHGLADDAVSCLALANNFKKKLLIAPAMNHDMLAHPATQKNIHQLREWGAIFIEGESGSLACGEYGSGRLAEPDQLIAHVYKHLESGAR